MSEEYAWAKYDDLADRICALADELDAEARRHAEAAEEHLIGSKMRGNLLSRALGKKVAAVRMREVVNGRIR